MLHGQTISLFYKDAPKHYLGYVKENKTPVILIPGLLEKWGCIKFLGDKISLAGHPVYIIPKLGNNVIDIPSSANIVQAMIEEKDIKNAVIVAHSKGGLIGKYLLSFLNPDMRVKRMISISTPYSGSSLVRFLPGKYSKELRTDSDMIKQLQTHKEVNDKIISIAPKFDNHVQEGCYLEGATNITVNEKGHHKIIHSKEMIDLIFTYL